MKTKMTKKFVSGILIISMILGLVSVGNLSGNVQTVKAETGETAGAETMTVNIQTNGDIAGITNPDVPTDTTSAWSGSKVYFGKYNNNPVLFRVLDAKTTDYSADGQTKTILLDSENVLKAMAFNSEKTSYTWVDSDVKTWMNGKDSTGFLGTFSEVEKAAIATSTKAEPLLTDGTCIAGVNWIALSNDKIFALDHKEVANESYGYINAVEGKENKIKRDTNGKESAWWLRSDVPASSVTGFVSNAGKQSNADPSINWIGVSPAMNLDLSSILYASASGLQPSSKLVAVGNEHVANNTWKLTLLDDSKTVGIQEGKSVYQNVYQNGTIVTVPYTYAGSDISQLSIMITSTERTSVAAEILYYGALTTVTGEEGSGTATFKLPSDLPEGYKIYLLAEDVNEGNFTNYASEPVEIGIVISEDLTADFATFRDGDTMEAPTAPTSGYVFAGWYYDEACANLPVSLATKDVENGKKVYAKFVPEKVLSVNAQARYTKDEETDEDRSKIDLRLVTTVDSFGYQEVGFIVTNRDKVQKEYSQQYVFDSLIAAGYERTPSEINPCSIRFGTINIIGITVSGDRIDPNREIPVQAYWITKDGTRVTGPARTIKMSDAVESADHAQATLSGTY